MLNYEQKEDIGGKEKMSRNRGKRDMMKRKRRRMEENEREAQEGIVKRERDKREGRLERAREVGGRGGCERWREESWRGAVHTATSKFSL